MTSFEMNPKERAVPKMSKLGAYFALLKAYCAVNVLLLPLSFVNGVYLLSPIAILVACFFETLCAVRLSHVANRYKLFSYPMIALKALGKKGYTTIRILLALAHF